MAFNVGDEGLFCCIKINQFQFKGGKKTSRLFFLVSHATPNVSQSQNCFQHSRFEKSLKIKDNLPLKSPQLHTEEQVDGKGDDDRETEEEVDNAAVLSEALRLALILNEMELLTSENTRENNQKKLLTKS